MKRELNLLNSFPKLNRDLNKLIRSEENKRIASEYDREFFDGERVNGYGGYYYDGRWKSVAKKLGDTYGIDNHSSILDIGCAKGFLLHDLLETYPGIEVAGIDISRYAVNKILDGYSLFLQKEGHSNKESNELERRYKERLLPKIIVGDSKVLPWADKTFDVILNINTIHNLDKTNIERCIQEMNRVTKNKENMFIQVDSFSDENERIRMEKWALTAKTILSKEEWKKLFEETGYIGDYYWTIV